VVIAGHALVQNVRLGHDELAAGEPTNRRVAAFDELAMADLIRADVGLQPVLR